MKTPLVGPMLAAMICTLMACATSTPYKEPVQTTPLTLEPGQELGVDQVIVLFDASGSIDPKDVFPDEKAWIESFVGAMPEGSYDASLQTFGGDERKGGVASPFNRGALASQAKGIKYMGGDSPIADVIASTTPKVEGTTGRTAVILVTDGVPNAPEWGDPAQPEVEAARAVAASGGGEVCYHTVLAGDDPAGAALLQEIAAVTDCGSFRSSDSLASSQGIEGFQEEMFVAAAPVVALPAVAAAPGDLDGDGVIDGRDECPATPSSAPVDDRGCWVLENIKFGSNSDELVVADRESLGNVVAVMNENPDLKIEVAGFTDSTGPAAYNQQLSERRAARIAEVLSENGVDASRIDVKGYGEANPIADNATPEGRAENRRIEISVVQ